MVILILEKKVECDDMNKYKIYRLLKYIYVYIYLIWYLIFLEKLSVIDAFYNG